MISTVTPGLSWSAAGGVGSVSNRFASVVVNPAPSGGLSIWTFIVCPSSVSVADVLDESMATVAFVCIRHWIPWEAVISSWRRTCFRPFRRRMPRFTEVL